MWSIPVILPADKQESSNLIARKRFVFTRRYFTLKAPTYLKQFTRPREAPGARPAAQPAGQLGGISIEYETKINKFT